MLYDNRTMIVKNRATGYVPTTQGGDRVFAQHQPDERIGIQESLAKLAAKLIVGVLAEIRGEQPVIAGL